MGCSQCQSGGANVFGERSAEWLVRRYHKLGPDKTTRMLLDALRAEGVEGLTLLDIGGGIGVIGLELLKGGVTAATEVEASPAYAAAARAEARRAGAADRVVVQEGDFVALAEEVPESGIVMLDRVICCYPDMPALVGKSAAKAGRLYGAVYPRDTWWMRAGVPVMNLGAALFRNPFRFYAHRTAAVDGAIRGAGLAPRSRRTAGFWQVVVYGRAA